MVEQSRSKVYKTVNVEMINLYWNIGKMIVNNQGGDEKAKYKDYIIENLAIKLSNEFGRGFSKRNLERIRKFYMCFPIRSTLMSELSWAHYLELIKIKEKHKRDFYMQECINSNWDVRQLQRQRTTLLYERLAVSKDKTKILELSTKAHRVSNAKDFIGVIECEKRNLELL